MNNWKSKYLKYKLKYLNLINQKGGMNSTEEAERLKILTETFNNNNSVRELISEAAANINARELYETKKQEILNEINYQFRCFFPECFTEGAQCAIIQNLMVSLKIEWNDIEKIEEASVEDINKNLLQNKQNIIQNIEENITDLINDY